MKALGILQLGILKVDKHIVHFNCGCQMYYNLDSGNKVLNMQCCLHQAKPGCVSVKVGHLCEDWLTNLS